MKAFYALLLGTSLLALNGCFGSDDSNTTKDNTEGNKSSIQMQTHDDKDDAEE
ncbi:hypothetical protein [Pseudomonas sp. EL_65y_Pfl2_R95]|uniref:hypothetical protein n=1 Tax=Pseudomonas sp. EL_65y_Pfl2_R95 TaxID=3088698 RepID=UPI0030DCDC35